MLDEFDVTREEMKKFKKIMQPEYTTYSAFIFGVCLGILIASTYYFVSL